MTDLNNAAKSFAADNGIDFDGGTGKCYTGASPGAGNAASGTLLGTVTLPDPCLGAAVNGVRSKAGDWTTTAVADGVAGYWRLENAGRIMDLTVGDEVTMSNVNILTGGELTADEVTVTVAGV